MIYAEEQDIPVLIQMFDENMGKGYMSADEIRGYIQNPKELVFAARRQDGSICGILLFGEETAEDLSVQTTIPAETLLKIADGKKLLKCRSLCIATDCQKSGIGRELFNGAIRTIRESHEYGVITSLLWEYNGTVPAQKLHEDNGFQFMHHRRMPWYHLTDYQCVVCGGRCRCDGLQYILKLEDQ